MANGPRHEISKLDLSPGKLSFDTSVGGETRRIWFKSETEVEPYAEAALAAALMPAMRSGGTLAMSDPISPRVLRNQREFQAIQRAWSLEWQFGDPPLHEVEIEAPTRNPAVRPPTGRTAAFFSGGVDSWSTVLSEPELTDLIFVRGIDILDDAPHQEGLADQVEGRLRGAAEELGLAFHSVETNLRELSDPLVRWEAYYGCAMAAVALFLGPAFDRVLIAGDADYEVQVKLGANWMVDQLWSTESLEIVDDGGRRSRMQRVAQIASHPVVQKSLRVCWLNPEGAYNCGHCRKCLMTMAALEAVGALGVVETLPSELDLEALARLEISQPVSLTPWEDMRDAARAAGKTDLELALGAALDGSKRTLGLPSGHRRRSEPLPVDELDAPGGSLLAPPETARALADAGAAALLVGSYDGSGNYGDIAQLDGALGVLEKLEPALLVLPVIERQYAQTHSAMVRELLHQPAHVLYFDDGRGSFEDDLVPLPTPELGFALSYLYGGGFLNPSWGARKLAMLRAVERLVEGAGEVTRVATGQQVDREWIAGLEADDARLLVSFELLGARDDASAQALAQVPSAAVAVNTGDDAVGVLTGTGAEPSPDPPEDVVNVHIAEHEWVTDDPDAVRSFDVGLLAELARIAGRPLRVRPLLAYLDPRVDERPGLERFTAACAEGGIEVDEAHVLRPATIAAEAPELGRALLTVSCSYHVALTSLLLAVPTVILRDNPYYDQKARGLLADFGLPPEFSPSSQDDPLDSAKLIAGALFEDGEQSRARLRETAAKVKRRRTDAEADLLRRVARGAIVAAASTGPSPGAAHPRPLEQRALAAERREAEAERQAIEAQRQAAEARATLEEIMRSRSWTITEPLRRLTARRRDR